jgi:CheY-like chemotaxis protein
MDGMEATHAIRALGGRFSVLPIAALTANVVSGMKEKFLAAGFTDFLPKPIETDELDALLQRWIPAAKQQSAPADAGTAPADAAERLLPDMEGVDIAAGMARVGGSAIRYRDLLHMFIRDVEANFVLFEAIPDKAGLASFTTFVHALKSGLANIGAHALSESAALLETAGRSGDLAAIRERLAPFRDELVALTARIGEAVADSLSDVASPALLRESLAALKAALEAKDTDGTDIALAKLQDLQLSAKMRADAADIAQHILFGDFKKALSTVNNLLELVLPERH